jgi:hypothetical protein
VASICVEYWGDHSLSSLPAPPLFMASASERKKLFKSQMLVGEFWRILDTKIIF